ncbi:chloride channel protein [Methanofollis ethanolicus]|uniref:chloride channel protein n=1 Tax=Methanofollis ethanolicus TaxID=488124 RepID=UPI00082F733A|nr:chloride channel protein [Methanofollis ethanolicus]
MTPYDPVTVRESLRFVLVAVILAVAAGGAMVIFLAVQSVGTTLVWQDQPPLPFFTLIVATAGGLAVGLCLHLFGDHVGLLQETIAEFRKSGRFEPAHLPVALLAVYLSLIAGASLGPEVAAIDLGGGMGTAAGERMRGMATRVRDLSTAGILGSLVGFGVYVILTGPAGALYPVPPYAFALLDLVAAAALGIVGGAAGVAFIAAYHVFHRLFSPLAGRHLLRGVIGGVGLGILGTITPVVLFSGQTEFREVLASGAALGGLMLLALVGVKILASTWCMATVFKGGPVFPLFFAGGTLGMAVNLLVPAVPLAITVPAAMAGMTVAVLKAPWVVVLLVVMVIMQWTVVPAVAVATIAGYLTTRWAVLCSGEGE